jgi:uncharacterized protein
LKPVFLDTVGILAMLDRDDQWHSVAAPVYESLVRSGRPMVTTPLVFYECGNAASRGLGRPKVDALRRLMASEGQVIEPTAEEVEAAWSDYVRGLAGEAGIVDHVSFAVMRRLGLTDAFTNDKHFAAAGFTTLF